MSYLSVLLVSCQVGNKCILDGWVNVRIKEEEINDCHVNRTSLKFFLG